MARLHRAHATSRAPTTGSTNADGNKPGDQCWALRQRHLQLQRQGRRARPGRGRHVEAADDDGTRIDASRLHRRAATATTTASTGRSPPPTAPSTSSATTGCRAGRRQAGDQLDLDGPVFGNDTGEPCHAATLRRLLVPAGLALEPGLRRRPARQRDRLLLRPGDNSYGRNLKPPTTPATSAAATSTASSTACARQPVRRRRRWRRSTSTAAERCMPERAGVTCDPSITHGLAVLVGHAVGPELRRRRRLRRRPVSPAVLDPQAADRGHHPGPEADRRPTARRLLDPGPPAGAWPTPTTSCCSTPSSTPARPPARDHSAEDDLRATPSSPTGSTSRRRPRPVHQGPAVHGRRRVRRRRSTSTTRHPVRLRARCRRRRPTPRAASRSTSAASTTDDRS